MYISEDGKPYTSSRSDNPNTKVTLLVYHSDLQNFTSGGRSALLNVTSTLICDISKYVNTANTTESVITLDFESIESNEILTNYALYHDNLTWMIE